MRIAICKAYGQEFYGDAPEDLQIGDLAYIQYAKDKRTAAEVVSIGEYPDTDATIQMLLRDKPKKTIVGKIIMFRGKE